jgi:trehalose 2-sulfotransferase
VLLDFETGYEGKFDFPARSEPPAIPYMIATIPRTGSSYLSHVLWRSGCLGAPLEYLNFDPAGPYFFASTPEQQARLWRSVLRRRTSPNGVFGVKCFPVQLQQLEDHNPALIKAVMSMVLGAAPPRIVHLARRDRVAHMVSYARAQLSGIWRGEQEKDGRAPLAYSEETLEVAGELIDGQEAAWEEMFRDMRIEPLRLWYEDVAERPDEAVRQVADYLGVALDPAAVVEIPPVAKQAEGEARRWIEQYARSKGLS